MAGSAGDIEVNLEGAETQTASSFTSPPHLPLEEPHGVTCPICLMKFKNPRRLKCEHTFCRSCLQSIADQHQESNFISCLMCQEKSELPAHGIDGFDSAIYVYSMGEAYDERERRSEEGGRRVRPVSQTRCSKCDGKGCTSCVRIMCNKCDKLTAAMVCKECEVYTCPHCWEEHGSDNPTHPPTPISQLHREVQELIRLQESQQGNTLSGQSPQPETTGNEPQQPTSLMENSHQLNDPVNAAATEVSQEEHEMEVVIPKSEKRKSNRPKSPSVVEQDEVYYTAHSCMKTKGIPNCSKLTAGFIAVLAVSVTLFVTLVLVCILLSVTSRNTGLALDRMTVLVARLQPFWYRYAFVSSEAPRDTYHYQTDLFFNRCDRFEIKDVPFSLGYSGKSSTSSSIPLPTTATGEYAYLLPGSRLEFRILVTANIMFRECTIELELYDNFDDFSNRRGHRTIFSRCIRQADSSADGPAVVMYDITTPGFYYPLLSVPPTSSYNVTIVGTNKAYDLDSTQMLQNKCSLISNRTLLRDECEFLVLQEGFSLFVEDYCIIANTTAENTTTPSLPPPFISLTVSTTANVFRNILYVLTLSAPPLYFPACFLLWCCYRCIRASCQKCYNKFATKEYATSAGGVNLEQL